MNGRPYQRTIEKSNRQLRAASKRTAYLVPVAVMLITCTGGCKSEEEECTTASDCEEGELCKFGDCVPESCVDPVPDPEDKSWHMIPDRNLRQAVKDMLGMTDDEELVYRDIKDLKELDAANSNVGNLSGLQCFLALERLYLDNNRIANLSPISGLTKLKELHLNQNRVSNLNPVAELVNLESLQLWQNQIANLTPLTSLASLSVLNLEENNVSDLAPLVDNQGLGDGDMVNLKGNNVDCTAQAGNIQALRERGVLLFTDCDEDDGQGGGH